MTFAERRAADIRTALLDTVADVPSGHLSLAAWRRIARAVEREIDRERVAEGGAPGFRIVPAEAGRRPA